MEPAGLAAVVIGHMHADHFIDLAALRYAFAWGERSAERLPVLLPPGGLPLFAEVAGVVSERPGFFDDAFDVREYDPALETRVGDLDLSFLPGNHYVPAWGVALTAADGTRLVYAGDTGPNPDLVAAAHAADLLVCEATLGSAADDDPARRGHLSLDEAVDHAQRAAAARLLVTHYPSARRETMTERLAELGDWAMIARPDLVVEVARGSAPPARAGARSGRGRSAPGRDSLAARR
jgi:ribonuclease BN (tRNA processing enzyme)